MILKALYDYYYRSGDLAPAGMEYKEIAFLVVIDTEGNFIRLEDRRIDNKSSNKFLVLKGMRSGTIPKPYAFWDNVEYVLNYTKSHLELNEEDAKDEMKVQARCEVIQKAAAKNRALIEKCESIADRFPENIRFRAVCFFYKKGELDKVKETPLWESIAKKPTVNISFLLEGEMQIVAEDKALTLLASLDNNNENEDTSVCLITGKHGTHVESTTPTAIPDGQATGRLVAFQVNSGYDSYGKSKGLNAPISKEAEASYTTALKNLLDKDSHNRFLIANRTFLFWASSDTETAREAECGIFSLLGYANEEFDDPNHRIEQVRKVFNAIYSGTLHTSRDDKFYFLGLAPNSARIAVVYWSESKLIEFAKCILKHFDDMEIVDTRLEKKPYYGLRQLMSAVALKGKTSDVQPNLPENVIKSMLQGIPYPYAFFLACIKRIRAEQQVTIARAAIVKAYLNRINDNHKRLKIMIDKENENQGYVCGRLFATLEYLQERSNGINTIRSRYMNAASATPSAVFATLLNLSVHHAEKLEKSGQIYFEQMKAEIMDKISAEGFPPHLDLQDQGRFMVGYYHQRQAFWTKKTDVQENNIEQ